MKAIILAAGVSRRLYPHTYNIPKCLLEVGGKPILQHQLSALEEYEINEIIIINGYHREMLYNYIEEYFPNLNIMYITNHHYFETNTAYSVYLARTILASDDFILMNADVVYPLELFAQVLQSDYKTALAVDVKPCGREEVKVIDGGGNKIVDIGKNLIESQCLGEFIGIAKLSKSFNSFFCQSLENLVEAGGKNDYFEAAIQPLLEKTEVYYEDVSEFPCIEIDFIEDLEYARKLF